ncbi:zinc finger protein 16 isoform X1 [Bombyx mori]|uniref:C2H2-type domain-containing protein n=1 Tax=Bombyx mori TaxID=7091 RepID=A0A8R1WEZ4_BOMMO|nr:zinc finger protein 16 isoform X1 [Bombyx mori]XP_037877312.1 zinc finger protein 16-like isoform X1 [Bombyx mori]
MTAEDSTNKLQCSLCNKQFKYESERKRHEQSHSLHFQCQICSKKFNFLSALRRHEKQHSRKGSVQCNKCGGKFRDEVLLKRHFNYAHKGTFICEECGASFSSKPALRTHLKIHRPESERRYKCSVNGCRKTFNFPHHLKHHELTHKNEKPHFCSICGKGFIQSHHLKAHLRTHEPDNWLYCDVTNCKKKFATDYARKRHQETHRSKLEIITTDTKSITEPLVEEESLQTTLCTNCGQIVFQIYYNEHVIMCKSNFDNNKPASQSFSSDKEAIDHSVSDVDVMEDVSSCKTILGGCLLESEGRECLCEQMSRRIGEGYDDPAPQSDANSWTKSLDREKNVSENFCDGCECSKVDEVKDTKLKTCLQNTISTTMTDLENRTIKVVNGAIKVLDICDIVMPEVMDAKQTSRFEIPNSCREMLGECIVNGSGEGCLCAQMKFEQIAAEEIANITPQPKI